MELQEARIDTSDPLRPTVRVSGVDVSESLERAVFVVERGSAPRLILELSVSAEVLGLAFPEASAGTDDLVSFLSRISPDQLESDMLQAYDNPEVQSPGQAALFALLSYVKVPT